MAGCGLVMAQSARPVLPLAPRFEHGAWVQSGNTPTAGLYTVLDEHTLGYFCFIDRSLIFTYFCIVL